jgi:hypothetical protein
VTSIVTATTSASGLVQVISYSSRKVGLLIRGSGSVHPVGPYFPDVACDIAERVPDIRRRRSSDLTQGWAAGSRARCADLRRALIVGDHTQLGEMTQAGGWMEPGDRRRKGRSGPEGNALAAKAAPRPCRLSD